MARRFFHHDIAVKLFSSVDIKQQSLTSNSCSIYSYISRFCTLRKCYKSWKCYFFLLQPSDDESDLDEKPLPPPPPLLPPESPPPPPFRNRNAYVNDYDDDYQGHSHHQHRNQNHYNAYNYTDSEASSSHYGLSLNSGQVVINNAAGSRAPLPGFSSFVW